MQYGGVAGLEVNGKVLYCKPSCEELVSIIGVRILTPQGHLQLKSIKNKRSQSKLFALKIPAFYFASRAFSSEINPQ